MDKLWIPIIAGIVVSIIFGLLAIVWKSAIEEKFATLTSAVKDLSDIMRIDMAKVWAAFKEYQTVANCIMHHDYHSKDHCRIDGDLNSMGKKVEDVKAELAKKFHQVENKLNSISR